LSSDRGDWEQTKFGPRKSPITIYLRKRKTWEGHAWGDRLVFLGYTKGTFTDGKQTALRRGARKTSETLMGTGDHLGDKSMALELLGGKKTRKKKGGDPSRVTSAGRTIAFQEWRIPAMFLINMGSLGVGQGIARGMGIRTSKELFRLPKLGGT